MNVPHRATDPETASQVIAPTPMITTSLSFDNIHEHGALFVNLLRARRESFIVRKNWELPEAMGMEYDQYDNPSSRWVAVHDDAGRILGGLRLTPTTSRCGIYSYMIRDAQLGLIDSLPQDILDYEAPVDPVIWECTRVFVDQTVPQSMRRSIHLRMVAGMIHAALDYGALELIAITPANWPRWYRRRGLSASAAGPVFRVDDADFQCVRIDLRAQKQ